MKIGDAVTYVDTVGVEHDALLTAVHGPYCVNLLYVAKDESRTDSFGRQILRESSVTIQSDFTAHGRYFKSKAA